MPELWLGTGYDTYVQEANPSFGYPNARFLGLRSGDELVPLFHMPINATRIAGKDILSAVLSIPVEANWITQTVTIQALASSWKVAGVTYANKPGVTGPTASSGATGALAPGGRFTIDVTTLVQQIANGDPNYGWRLTTSQSTQASQIRSFGSGYTSFTLTVEFVDRPTAPTQLSPEGIIGIWAPVLSVDDTDALAAMNVQVDATPSGTNPDYDSGWVATTRPRVDLAVLFANHLPSTVGDSGTFDTDINNWGTVNCAIARVTTPVQAGAGALRLTATAGADMSASPTASAAFLAPVVAGQTVHMQAYSRANATTRSTRIDLLWYDSGASLLSTTTGTASTNSAASYGLREVTAEAPAGAAYARPRLYVVAPAAAEIHYWDSVRVSTGTSEAANITDGATTYWRARVKLLNGGESFYSQWAEITRDDKPTVIDDTGTTIYDPSPEIEAHLSPAGTADTRWQVIISDVGDPSNVHYNSGDDIEGAVLSHQVPLRNRRGQLVFADDGTYRREIRAWDRTDRVPSQGDLPYAQRVDTITLNADGALGVPTLTVSMVEPAGEFPRPRLHITGLATSEWVNVRRDGEFLTRFDVAEFTTGVGIADWDDESAPPNVEHRYAVRAGTAASGTPRMSASSNVVTVTAKVTGVWLRSDFGDLLLYGDGIDAAQVDKRQTFEMPYSRENVDIVTSRGGFEGTFAGVIDRRSSDIDADLAQIADLRAAPHAEVRLVWGTQNIWVHLRGLSVAMSPSSLLPDSPIHDVRFGFFQINPRD